MMNLPDSVSWLWPLAFLALPLPLLVYALAPAKSRRPARALRLPDASLYGTYTSENSQVLASRWFRMLLLCLVWIALVTAAARPQSFADPVGVPVTGRDLFLGIDISESMREADLYAGNTRASRMNVVKVVAQDFITRRTGDRIGLIMFGEQAYVQTPLTYDHETVQHFLGDAVVGLAGMKTAIGDAIGLAVKRLRERAEASRVLILLTDGANTAGVDPVEAAEMAAQSGIRIYAIGVAPEMSQGIFGRRSGGPDETTLRTISESTGGQYFRARDQQDLANIYLEIDRLEPTEQDVQEFRPLNELFVWPLAVALMLSLLWAVLRSGASFSGRASEVNGV